VESFFLPLPSLSFCLQSFWKCPISRYCQYLAPLDLDVPLPDLDFDLSFFLLSLFPDLYLRSTLKALPDVSADPKDFPRASSLRSAPTTSSNFKVPVPQEVLTAITKPSQASSTLDNRISALISSSKLISIDSNWLVSLLNSLRCLATLPLSAIFRLNNSSSRISYLTLRVFRTFSIGLPSSLWSSFPWRHFADAMDNQIASRAFRSRISYSPSALAYGAFLREENRNISGIGSVRSASFKTRNSRHWIFWPWSFLHQPSRTKCSDISSWGIGFHDGDKEQIKSETTHKITGHQNVRRKPKQENHRVTRKSAIIEKL